MPQPLAARMRPRTLDEFVGQRHLLAPGKPLREAIEKGTVGSMVFWGPPGTGKTTIARVIAQYTDREFVPFSAVTEGVPRVREIVAEAEGRRRLGRGTILFADEIHRFNKAQQDAFLPHVEAGTITLIGATTENPSFEINGALLSRVRVFVLQALTPEDIERCSSARCTTASAAWAIWSLTVDEDALDLISVEADGDARRALTVLEAAAEHVGRGGHDHRRGGARCAAAALRALRQGRRRDVQHAQRLPQESARQRPAGRAVLDGADDRRRRRSDDHVSPRDRDGGRGRRSGRSRSAEARGGGA